MSYEEDNTRIVEAWANVSAAADLATAGGIYPADINGVAIARIDQKVIEDLGVMIAQQMLRPLSLNILMDQDNAPTHLLGALGAGFSMGLLVGIEFQKLGGTTS